MASYKLLSLFYSCLLSLTQILSLILGTESLADYDDLVREDPEDVTMEDANRILNEDDDQPEGAASSRDGTGPSAAVEASKTKEHCGDRSSIENNVPFRNRTDSTVSSLSGIPRKSDTLTSLYFSTAKAREAAAPPRVLGGGADPLPYWRFGALFEDNRHVLAFHRHVFNNTQNISTSFDPKDLTCHVCAAPHPVLVRAGGEAGSINPKCFIITDQCFPPVCEVHSKDPLKPTSHSLNFE
jgi:hypothetical protein